jgi:hypothetical protein
VDDRRVKGSHILQAARWIDEHLGEGTFRTLTKSAGARWGIILPGAWYEIDILQNALAQASDKARMSVEDVTTEIAARNAAEDLTTIYRIFLRVAQPQTVLSFTPKLWRTYVNFATARAVLNERKHYIGRGEGFSAELMEWAAGCWRGFIPAAIRMAGGGNPRGSVTQRSRMPNGLYAIEFEVRYH